MVGEDLRPKNVFTFHHFQSTVEIEELAQELNKHENLRRCVKIYKKFLQINDSVSSLQKSLSELTNILMEQPEGGGRGGEFYGRK